jgi:hypothetical protein
MAHAKMKKILLYIIFLGLSILLFVINGFSQLMITHNSPQNINKLMDVFNLNIDNNLGISTYVFLEVELTEQNYGYTGLIKTEKFLLANGSSIIDPTTILINSKSFSGLDFASYLKNAGVFGPGQYKANINLKSASDNNSLTFTMVSFKVDKLIIPTENSSSTQQGKSNTGAFNPNFSTSGTAEVLGYFSAGQPPTTLTPASYLQLNLSPQVSIFDVPVGAKIFLTTQQNSGLQSMNYFRLNFDANAFRGMLMKRLMEMVTKKANLDKMNLSNFNAYKDQLSNINNTLKNPGVLQEMVQIKELDSLKQQFTKYKDQMNISDTSLMKYMNVLKDSLGDHSKDGLSKFDSLRTTYTDSIGKIKDTVMANYEKIAAMYEKIKGMGWLEDKKQYYDQLLGKKEQIMNYGKKLGCLDSLGNFTNKIENFDAKKYSDPSNLYSALKNSKLIKKFEKYLFWIKSVNIGMHSPMYSNYSLNGVNVNGFGIELEPYKFYAAFSYGETLRPVLTSNISHTSYKRNLVAFKVGYGRTENSHIHFNLMSAVDDSSSVNPRDSLYLHNKLPQDNKVMSIDFKLTLFKKKLSISGELAGSQTIRDLTYHSTTFNFVPVINGNNNTTSYNDWFVNIISQQGSDLNTQVDYAVNCKVEGKFFEGSNISAGFSRIGPRFQSFGLPFLVKDRMMGEVKASQKFWKNRISISGFFRYNIDNLDSTKALTSQFFNGGFDLKLNIPKLPVLSMSYMPVTIQNDSTVMNMNILNANCYHTYTIKKTGITSILNYVFQTSNQLNGNTNLFNLHNVNLTNIIAFQPLSINNSLSYISNITPTTNTNTFITSLSTSFTLLKKWTNTVGGNLYINENSIKGGGFYQSSLSLIKNLVFNIRIETNRFNTYLFLPGYQDYTQFLCRTSIQYKW